VHRELCRRLLAEEVAACNRGRLRQRLRHDVELEGDYTVVVRVDVPAGARYVLALTGDNYNAEPLSLGVLDPETGEPLPEEGWPPRLRFGSPHPVTQRPWSCTRGLAEYYMHYSHVGESWDADRVARRLEVLVGHLLNKMDVPK
jgi:hypothetical protein